MLPPLAQSLLGLSSTQWALIVAAAAIIITLRRWRINTMNKNNRSLPPKDRSLSTPALNVREVATELQALLAELEETSRRLTAQLDNRYTRLEQLMVEADEKIRTLESLRAAEPLHANGSLDADDFSPAPAPPAAPPAPRAAPPHSPPRAPSLDAQRALQRLRQERGAPAASEDPAYQPIYSLADRGQSPREIAQQLGRQPGEIELILALRQRT